MHKFVKDVKDIVEETVKELEKMGCNEFTTKQLRTGFHPSVQISSGWLTECLNSIGYHYDRVKRVWTKRPAQITKTTYIKDEVYQKIKSKLYKVEDKIVEILTGIANDDYCSRCKKKITCKHYNLGENFIIRLFARKDICKAHKKLIEEIVELGRIVNEQ